MKKPIIVMILLVLAISCVFAGKSSITVKVSPYSYQYVEKDAGYSSTYGFSFQTGYRYDFNKGLSVGADLKYSNYRYNELSNAYHVISLMPNAGWSFFFGDKWSATANLGAGIQKRIIGDKSALFFATNLYLGAGYKVTEKVAITLGADLGLAFQKGSKDFSVDAMLGTAILL